MVPTFSKASCRDLPLVRSWSRACSPLGVWLILDFGASFTSSSSLICAGLHVTLQRYLVFQNNSVICVTRCGAFPIRRRWLASLHDPRNETIAELVLDGVRVRL